MHNSKFFEKFLGENVTFSNEISITPLKCFRVFFEYFFIEFFLPISIYWFSHLSHIRFLIIYNKKSYRTNAIIFNSINEKISIKSPFDIINIWTDIPIEFTIKQSFYNKSLQSILFSIWINFNFKVAFNLHISIGPYISQNSFFFTHKINGKKRKRVPHI